MDTPESDTSRKYPQRKREQFKKYKDLPKSMAEKNIKKGIKTEVKREKDSDEKENVNDSQNENTSEATPTTRKYPTRKRAPVKYYEEFELSQEDSKIKVEVDSDESKVGKEESDEEEAEDFSDIDTTEISEYEKLRLRNLEENRRMMIELGLIDPGKKKKLKLEPKPKKIKKKPVEVTPRQKSLRLLKQTPDGSPLDIFKDSPKASPEVSPKKIRKPEDVLPMGEDGETIDFLDNLKGSFSQDSGTSSLASTDNLINDLRNLKLVDVKKVTSDRVQSLCIHPSEKKLLTFVGSTNGELGLWDVNGMEIAQFEPHCRAINCISVSEYDQSKVFTTSHDGTVRRADLCNNVFDLMYQTGEEQDSCHLTWHTQLDQSTLMVAHGTGDVGFVDLRSKQPEKWYQCHRRSIRTIHIHPNQPQYFLTTSGIGECKIWDMRGMKKHCDNEAVGDLSVLDTGKGLTSGFFSPDGNKVVTTCNDDRLRVYDTSDLSGPKLLRKILHDNHTGRWLSVFKAQFHPLSSDLILVGSMLHPRRIQMFNCAGVLLQELKDTENMTTVTPVVAVHPSLPVVVGGNSSGKAHFFTTQDVLDSQDIHFNDE